MFLDSFVPGQRDGYEYMSITTENELECSAACLMDLNCFAYEMATGSCRLLGRNLDPSSHNVVQSTNIKSKMIDEAYAL